MGMTSMLHNSKNGKQANSNNMLSIMPPKGTIPLRIHPLGSLNPMTLLLLLLLLEYQNVRALIFYLFGY